MTVGGPDSPRSPRLGEIRSEDPDEGVGAGRVARFAAPSAAIAIALVLIGLAIYSVAMDRRASAATADAERALLVARAYGAFGEVVETTAGFAPAFARAEAAGRPALLELRVDGTDSDGCCRCLRSRR